MTIFRISFIYCAIYLDMLEEMWWITNYAYFQTILYDIQI